MVKKRRYDTEALVGQLRAERRTGILLSVAAVAVLGLLVLLYLAGTGSDEDIPVVPESETAQANSEAPSKAPDKAPPPSAPVAEPTSEPGTETGAESPGEGADVVVTLTKKSAVWLGKKKLGKIKKKQVQVPVGTHQVRVKLGKRTLEHTLEVKGGEKLTLMIDHKKRTITVTER